MDAATRDEDVLILPAGWRRQVVPRRREEPVAPPTVDAKAVAAYLAGQVGVGSDLEAAAGHGADRELLDLHRAEAGRLAEATPAGAAVAAALTWSVGTRKAAEARAVVDAWVAARGMEFAALATVERADIVVQEQTAQPRRLGRISVGMMWVLAQPRLEMAGRMRHHLAAATDEEYRAVTAALAPYQGGDDVRRTTAAFLVPDQVAWTDAIFRENRSDNDLSFRLVRGAVSTPQHVEALFDDAAWRVLVADEMLPTLLDGVGAAMLPYLAAYADMPRGTATEVEKVLTAIAALPGPEAFQALMDRVKHPRASGVILAAAAARPRLALRMLAASGADRISPLLRSHVAAHPGVAAAAVQTLSGATRQRVEACLGAGVQAPAAAAEALPAWLVTPPWSGRATPARAVTVAGLTAPAETRMVWLRGERDDWRGRNAWRSAPTESWEQIATAIRARRSSAVEVLDFFLGAPDEPVLAILEIWNPPWWRGNDLYHLFVARFEERVLPLILLCVDNDPAQYGSAILPYADSSVAPVAAAWLTTPKQARTHAVAWLRRHPGVAARALIPSAVGRGVKTTARRAAERALLVLAEEGFEADVRAAASTHGPAAAAAVDAFLAVDRAPQFAQTPPTLPAWAKPDRLPQVLLADRASALPADAVRNLCLMLALPKPGAPRAALAEVRAACDHASLAGLGEALFDGWLAAGMPSADAWALDALGRVGSDATAARLAGLIRDWPGHSAHHRAVRGLDVLAELGTDAALAQMYQISQKAKFRGLRERAAGKIGSIAVARGLTPEQLGDRLVPGLGLDAAGTLGLDFGARRFTVGFDERLVPFVRDAAGRRLKALPKAGADDDRVLAAEAAVRFTALKKEARGLAADQVRRLELAMVSGRRWTAEEFRRYLVGHPLLRHVARHLLWQAFVADDGAATAFRVAEDFTFADLSDDKFELDDAASVGLPHPLGLGAEAAGAWADVFADYVLPQPFPQLARTVFTLTADEEKALVLDRFSGRTAPSGSVAGLERFGWRRGDPGDHGIQTWMSRPVPGGGCVAFSIAPGLFISGTDAGPQTVSELWATTLPDVAGWHQREDRVPFGSVDAVTVSEVLRDLETLTTRG